MKSKGPKKVSNNSTTASAANNTSSPGLKISKGRVTKKSSRQSSTTAPPRSNHNQNPPPEQKPPVIVYTHAPTVIKATPEEFRILVHKLTGMGKDEHQQAGSSPPTSQTSLPPPPLPTNFLPMTTTNFLPPPTTNFLPTTTTTNFLPSPPPPPPPTSLPVQQHRWEATNYEDNNNNSNNRNVGGNLGIIGDNNETTLFSINETNNYYNNEIGGLSDLPMMNSVYLPSPLGFDHPTNLCNNNYNGIPFFKSNSADFLSTQQSFYNNYSDLLPSYLPSPYLGNAYSSFPTLDVLKDLPHL